MIDLFILCFLPLVVLYILKETKEKQMTRNINDVAVIVNCYEHAVDEEITFITHDGERFTEGYDADRHALVVSIIDAIAAGMITAEEGKTLHAVRVRNT
jgi:hypothetical protein